MKNQHTKRVLVASLCIALVVFVGVMASYKTTPKVDVPQDVQPAPTQVSEQESAQAAQPAQTQQPVEQASVDVEEPDPAYVDEESLWQFEAGATEAAEEEAPEPEVFAMPEDAVYEPEVALLIPQDGATPDEVNEALASVEGVESASVDEADLENGLVRVSVSQDASLEDVVNRLRGLSVTKVAQPNFIYDTHELVESESTAEEELQSTTPEEDSSSSVQEAAEDDAASTDDAEQEEASSTAQESEASAATTSSTTDAAAATADEEALATTDDPVAQKEEEIEVAEQDGTSSSDAAVAAESTSTNDARAGSQWGLGSIHANEAWDLQKTSGKVTVAIMDVGFNVNHEDLKDNILRDANNKMVVYDAGNQSGDVSPFNTSDRDHGTHVAGIIAATANNKVGIAGATYNACILPIRVASQGSSGSTSQVDSASIWRAFSKVLSLNQSNPEYNIRVVNFSLGSTSAIGSDGVFQETINKCYNNNIVVVTSAGNISGSSAVAHYPSDCSNCVAVIALQQSGSSATRWSGSNYNRNASDHKDVAAPGVDIYSTTTSSYGSMSGTSMSTAFASSVVALEYAEANALGKSLSAKNAIDILHATTTDLGVVGWDVDHGYGEVNAYAAVKAVKDGLTSAQNARLDDQAEAQQAEAGQYDTKAAQSVTYQTHVQNIGWQDWKSAGAKAGTSGRSLRLEGLRIKLSGAPYAGGITYRTHVQDIGWQSWKADGSLAGTTGRSKRLEAVEIKLTGEMANHYSVWYRVHCQDYGWMGWTCDGGRSGTATLSKRLEAIEIRILPKGSSAPGSTTRPYVTRQVQYRAHVQNYGWQGWAADGAQAGTTGKSLRLEGINIKLTDMLYSGGISYRTHIQNIGWQGWRSDGAQSGTTGRSLRLEAIRIQLYGEMAEHYDVWYRVHAQNIGWMGWASNGASAGTAGMSRRLEAIQIKILPKNSGAPGSTNNAFQER